MGTLIKTYQLWITIIILIITALVIMQPDSGNINYELIQTIIGLVVVIIGAIWTLFGWLDKRRSEEAKELAIQNHEILMNQDQKIDALKKLIEDIKAPFDDKIEKRKQKDIEQDKYISDNKKEIEKLQIRMQEVEKDMDEFKKHFDKRFDDLFKAVAELKKK